ncbi:hypothetical protein [Comamonas aquatica]
MSETSTPHPAHLAINLQHVLSHESWTDHTMAQLATTKANAKEIPLN